MNSSEKQIGIVAEAVRGTTPSAVGPPSAPAFLLLRDTGVDMAPDRPWQRSPERSANRRVLSTYRGLNNNAGRISAPFVYDAALQKLIASLMQSDWSSDVLKDASTLQPFTVEEKFENGGTDIYKRTTGAVCVGGGLSVPADGPAMWRFDTMALAEATATTALANSTYVPASSDDVFTAADAVLTTFWGLTVPKIVSLELNISQGARPQYQWGSRDPWGTGLGQVSFSGRIECYFTALTEYSTFVDGELGDLVFTLGHTTGQKVTFSMLNARGFAPGLPDAVNNGDQMVTINFEAHHDAGDASALKITRAVA